MSVEMKDSGINGIGLIPKSWHTKNLGVFFTENSKVNYAFSSSNALQFKYGEIIQKANNNRELEEQEIELLKRYILVEPNDIVVNGLNLNYDFNSLRIARVKESGIITSAYIVLRPKFDGDTSFFNYLLKTLDNQKIFHGMGVGIRLTLKFKELRSMLIPVPPHEEEQSRIANFLDKKCAEIDELIAFQDQMIAHLNTYKQAVITETVTKGLDPNVKMKDSGVEWIGVIPEHWNVAKLNYFVSKVGSGSTPTGGSSIYVSAGIKFLRSQNVHFEGLDLTDVVYISKDIDEGMKGTRVLKGDVLLNITGGSIGRCYYVDDTLGAANVNQHVCIIRPEKLSTVYLKYFLQSNIGQTQVKVLQNGGNREGLSAAAIKSFTIMNLSLSEQQSIANYLDRRCKEIDELISVKKEKIEQLKAYKKSVIFEYVTGKKLVK